MEKYNSIRYDSLSVRNQITNCDWISKSQDWQNVKQNHPSPKNRIMMPPTPPMRFLLVLSTMMLVHNCTSGMMTNNGPRRQRRSLSIRQLLPSSSHFRPDPSCEPSQMSGTDLAYIGDCVYELFVRSRVVWPSMRTSDLHQRVVRLVNGTYLRIFYRQLVMQKTADSPN